MDGGEKKRVIQSRDQRLKKNYLAGPNWKENKDNENTVWMQKKEFWVEKRESDRKRRKKKERMHKKMHLKVRASEENIQ